MKTNKTFLTLLLLSGAMMAQAKEPVELNMSQENGVYLLANIQDWNNLADYVADGNNCAGLTFKMIDNIGTTEAPVTRPIGQQISSARADRMRFAGTFDGNGYTLTVSISSTSTYFQYNKSYASPFAYTKGATIENLNVEGTITATGQFGSGLVGSSGNNDKDGSCTIRNCYVGVDIISRYKSSTSSVSNHGGFIGVAEGVVTLTNCCFGGQFKSENNGDFQCCGGFLGQNKKKAIFENCIFAMPQSYEGNADKAGQFSYDLKGGYIDENSTIYYTTAFGTVPQGKKVEEMTLNLDINANGSALNGQKRYFTTFYHPFFNFRLSNGAMALRMDSKGTLHTVGDGSIIPADYPVLIMSLTSTVTLSYTAETADTGFNMLCANYFETDTPSDDIYVVGDVDGSVGLIPYTGDKLPAGKAVYPVRKK